MPSATSATDSPRPATASAWLVVLVIGVIAAAVIIGFAFSANNARASVDGPRATSSQFLEAG